MFIKILFLSLMSVVAMSASAFELQYSDLEGHFKGPEEGCEFKFEKQPDGVTVAYSVNPGGSVHYFSQTIEIRFVEAQQEHKDKSIAAFVFAPGTDSPVPWTKITSAIFKFESPDYISYMEFFTPGFLWDSRDTKCTDLQKL